MARMTAFTIFATAIGPCAIAWGPRGIVGVQLPEDSEAATRARLRRRFPNAVEEPPPGEIAAARAAIQGLLRGELRELAAIRLDMVGVTAFERRVYEAARRIAPGATCSYGEIAAAIGAPREARAVGAALGRNPFPLIVPCHRVLAAGGRLGGFSAPGGRTTKRRLLAIESAASGALPLLAAARAQ